MTKEKFDLRQKAIIVSVDVEIDGMVKDFPFIVDTGSPETLICEKAIRAMGCTHVDSIEDVPIQTVGGGAMAYRYIIERMSALGVTKRNLKIISHPMPSGSGAYGLLGLDFFENTRLIIDFKTAEIIVDSS